MPWISADVLCSGRSVDTTVCRCAGVVALMGAIEKLLFTTIDWHGRDCANITTVIDQHDLKRVANYVNQKTILDKYEIITDTWHQLRGCCGVHIYLRRTAKFMFLPFSVGFVYLTVCLSVCPSISYIREEGVKAFSSNFQDRWDLVQGTFCNILGMFHLTHCAQNFVFYYLCVCVWVGGGMGRSGWFVSVGNITEKRMNGFSGNCQGRSDMRQVTIWNILRMLHLNLWIQDRFLFLFDPCLMAT